MEERLDRDKHSSLLQTFVNFITMGLGHIRKKLFWRMLTHAFDKIEPFNLRTKNVHNNEIAQLTK
jgi:hypothetical protein